MPDVLLVIITTKTVLFYVGLQILWHVVSGKLDDRRYAKRSADVDRRLAEIRANYDQRTSRIMDDAPASD